MDKDDLLKLIQDDDLGLLKIKPKQEAATSDDRLIASFCDINQFVNENGREPTQENGDINEYKLYARLKAIRTNEETIKALIDLDEHNLLKGEVKEIKSMKDVFEDDDLGIFQSDADNIFDLKNIPKETTMPGYVASRKKCKDFKEFENKLIQCQHDLANGKRQLWPFKKEQQIEKGSFFVLKGILLYIADLGERKVMKGKQNARLRCIFENGTESDMLLRSLAAELYKDGRRVTEHEDHLLDNFHNITLLQ